MYITINSLIYIYIFLKKRFFYIYFFIFHMESHSGKKWRKHKGNWSRLYPPTNNLLNGGDVIKGKPKIFLSPRFLGKWWTDLFLPIFPFEAPGQNIKHIPFPWFFLSILKSSFFKTLFLECLHLLLQVWNLFYLVFFSGLSFNFLFAFYFPFLSLPPLKRRRGNGGKKSE